MAKKRFQAEQIIGKLREAEVEVSKGQTIGQVGKKLGITEQTYYRWRKEYGGVADRPGQATEGVGERERPAEEAGGESGLGHGDPARRPPRETSEPDETA